MSSVEIIGDIEGWRRRFDEWKRGAGARKDGEVGSDYPFVRNRRAPFNPARRALPMLNLALISSAGAYIDGTAPFAGDGDASLREFPMEVESWYLRCVAGGYDPAAVQQDMNAEAP